MNISSRPDYENNSRNLSVYFNEDDKGRVSIGICHKGEYLGSSHKGEYLGSIKDYDKLLGFRKRWFVYILETVKKGKSLRPKAKERSLKYYTGYTHDFFNKRWWEHLITKKGSEWMNRANRYPISLGYLYDVETRAKAEELEQKIKNWSRERKEGEVEEFKNNNPYLNHVKFWKKDEEKPWMEPPKLDEEVKTILMEELDLNENDINKALREYERDHEKESE